MTDLKLKRRDFLKYGIGGAGIASASASIAQVCGLPTAEQSLGPFFPEDGAPVDPIREDQNPGPISLANDSDLTFVQGRNGDATGQIVLVEGQVTDENCEPIAGASLIIWQASSSGAYNHLGDSNNTTFEHPVTGETIDRIIDPYFQYWGRTITDENGIYRFKTIVPGFYPADLNRGWYRPPHIHFMVSATGFEQLVTQSYFRGEEILGNAFNQELNKVDLLLQNPRLSSEEKDGLIVDFASNDSGDVVGKFDIKLLRL